MRVRFGDDGLMPAIVQDAGTGRVLTLAWMNAESLAQTLETGETWFWSRSRNELWHKGATSGNTQGVAGIATDCDRDAIVVSVVPAGPACHTGETSCFHDPLQGDVGADNAPFVMLPDLEAIVTARAAGADPESSYTAWLLAKGIDTMCKKVGEEATEVAIAAKGGAHDQVVYESADLLYHLVVLWQSQGVSVAEVAEELASRRRSAG
ncbi:MAG: bifunctional phosphoribosyl-AMP cyclohydrolase/phosphoribosyl-ATP diphosphatase HisIE [Actinobacteria bacterium]|nr:bifunctional phosphoribosyl-AMP cyclohydrolase/phosphoribosyl-ATP diphosphatase HisIE [Actinomycetota bacterium]